MTTFERRQTILQMLQTQPSVKVTELAVLLDVSEGTIRNDLIALDQEQQIKRVRGGAVARDQFIMPHRSVAARAQVNSDVKQRLAQWAAGMIESGDSIILDASTTVFFMTAFLRDRHNLTVVTNGIEVARRLAEDPSNTVILLGGIVRSDGNAITGILGEKMLKDLHIRTAFFSCSGFSPIMGLTESDLQEAYLKSLMVQAAQRVVALVDYTKFDKMGVMPFARIDQIDHIITNHEMSPEQVEQLQQAGISLTICRENTVVTYAPTESSQTRYKIGFANLGEKLPFARDVRRGLERASQLAGNIDLIVADNQLSSEVALQLADDLIAQGIDLAIEYQIDAMVGNLIMQKFERANIPVIAVDIPMVGATFLGANNYHAGHVAGLALGRAVKQEWNGKFDRLIVLENPRPGDLPALRIQGQIDGFREVIGEVPESKIVYLDSGNTIQISEEEMLRLLEQVPDDRHLAVICFNDEAAVGALEAARQLGRQEDLLIVGQGADRRLRDEIRAGNSRIVGSTAFHPEDYGEKLIELALKILRGEPTPPAVYVRHIFINAENIEQYYPNGS